MSALFPPIFSSFGWPVEDPISHQQQHDYSNREADNTEEFPRFSPMCQPQIQLDRSASFSANSGDPTTAKKLYHNASERDRRKKMNSLYSALRSLLPAADQTKKLSIPITVSRVLKYLPELQQQVERLVQKKEELLSKISTQADLIQQPKQRQIDMGSNLVSISSSRLTDREIIINISTFKAHQCSLSEVLLSLEERGFLLMNASSFESSKARVFYNLHLQVEGTYGFDCEVISEKLKSLYEKSEELFLSNFEYKN